jgi:small subunit ribosomal protein S20
MANHQSAIKKYRQDTKRRMINKMNKSKMKTRIKLLRKTVAEGNNEEAKTLLPQVIEIIDKTVSKGTIHKNTGSRYKSRLSSLAKKAQVQS